ncbi:MAG: DUF4342 domain-containing protein [Anaerolineales bacterium]|nr:DUF4342 domain-containing protein [Anaerolineales bacterium]MCB8952179.1 DUF4342 domain-containing protein [Ardenticatenales bacterium]
MSDNVMQDEINVEQIKMEEEMGTHAETEAGKTWTEEMNVAAGELVETVKKLVHEAGVRRVVIRKKDGTTLLQVPLLMGLGGIALLPTYAALAIVAALATDHAILVVRVEKAQAA